MILYYSIQHKYIVDKKWIKICIVHTICKVTAKFEYWIPSFSWVGWITIVMSIKLNDKHCSYRYPKVTIFKWLLNHWKMFSTCK